MVEAPRSLYVYYRVARPQVGQARLAIEALQQQLQHAFPGLKAQLMQGGKAPAEGAELTWMEVYAHPPGISSACEQTLLRLVEGLPPDLTGPRHMEVFCPLADRPGGPA